MRKKTENSSVELVDTGGREIEIMDASHKHSETSRAAEHAAVVRELPVSYPDEHAWLEGLRRGERRAKALLFDRYARRLRRFLSYLTRSQADVDDLLQEVFLEAFSAAKKLRGGPEVIDAWINRITVYTARRALRRLGRRRRWLRDVEDHEIDVVDPDVDPETATMLARIYRLLEDLPPEDRIVLTLRYVEEQELTEVADHCGVSLATIKRRLTRARRRFENLASGDPLVALRFGKGAALS